VSVGKETGMAALHQPLSRFVAKTGWLRKPKLVSKEFCFIN
jgi:hypothetical protein